MQKFCTKCGSKLDEVTGKCPVCDKELTKKEIRKQKKEEKKEAKRTAKKEKWKKLSFKQKVKKISLRFVLILLVLLLLFCSGTATLVYFDIVDVPVVTEILVFFGIKDNLGNEQSENRTEEVTDNKYIDDSVPENDRYKVSPPDAEKFYANNSEVISKIDADKADAIQTESEIYEFLFARGFDSYPITTTYTMDGTYCGEKEIKNDSTEKHPIYTTQYVSESNDIWTISVINGSITANPVSYNLNANLDIPVIISERSSVMSYDSTTDKFYETIPNNTQMTLKEVERIDAATLESLANGGLDTL